MEDKEQKKEQWHHLERGRYLGEISALCFLHNLSSSSSSFPSLPFPFLLAGLFFFYLHLFLFSSSRRAVLVHTQFFSHTIILTSAGTGSEILVYNLPTGNKIASLQVFQGIRVHGITSHPHHHPSADSITCYSIAIFGERRVKLYKLTANATNILEFTLLHSLPNFTHWVLDVSFFKNGGCPPGSHQGGGRYCLAIGCSDNSLWFWDIFTCRLVFQVRCPDRCLLYSMRIWGSDAESLLVASGTIYNQIIVWKLDFKNHSRALRGSVEGQTNSMKHDVVQFCGQPYQAVRLCRLTGHEGSIFRIAWSSDGSKLVSVSDDRSARVWVVNTRGDGFCSPEDAVNHVVGPVLFGHTARVWDCCIFDNLIVTAGEDCTCRVWGPDGQQLKVIKEHIGRGVWRCLYDPITSLIVTAGLDSALKVYQMHSSSSKSSKRCIGFTEGLIDGNEVFTFIVPNSSGHIGLTDSKSEYVRCLHFSREDSLYVSTNNGYLHHILFDTGEAKWTELVHLDEGAPVICMDLLSVTSELSGGVEDWIAVGSGKGSMTVVHVVGHIQSPKVDSTLSWSAEIERQLLGTYWCKSLGNRFIFTADPSGKLKLWRLLDSLASNCDSVENRHDVCLLATYISCFGTRIMCLDASSDGEVLVCGDIRGNILLFTLSRSMLFGTSVPSEEKTFPVSYFKGAHGISSVCSITITCSSLHQVEICSTGQDGCICYLEHDKILQSLEFIGMKSVKELSAVRSVFWSGGYDDDLEHRGYAIGFASSDFIIWNLTSDTKVVKVACGGWRRPHSFYIGNFPEKNICVAFVKNEIIYIHRNWVHKSENELYPQNLHLQFHGREVHSVCFITGFLDYDSDKKNGILSKTIWVATGCEDGTVRLTRYEPGSKKWMSSKLLGEHVGGSAVRSLCCVSKMYTSGLDLTCMPSEVHRQNRTIEDPENPLLLISVGAKRVITAWKQRLTMGSKRVALCSGPGLRDENGFHGSSSYAISSSFSFQWLSTDMPTKYRNHEKRRDTEIEIKDTENAYATRTDELNISGNGKKILKDCLEDNCEDDWRYLAVTAFLVKSSESRISVCFVVVASSDSTVALRALLLPCRLWFDVAILSPSSSPVLALQHVVVCETSQIEDKLLVQSVYIVISGSTDGSITFWDLTKDVEDFMRRVSSLHIKDFIDSQRRPRTGRGSQGGRWWRALGSHVLKKKVGDEYKQSSHFEKGKKYHGSFSSGTIEKSYKDVQNHTVYGTSEMPFSEQHAPVFVQVGDDDFVSEENVDDSSIGVRKIAPLHVLRSVHQSGVNCLCVADSKDVGFSENTSIYYLLSGGDDQALNCFRFDLTMKAASQKEEVHRRTMSEMVNKPIYACQIQNYVMKFFSLEKIMSAHSSAVKGVWTDGNWVFSTGLDQRVRCWSLDGHGKLTERAHLVVSVPEPEALDAQACGRSHYQIIVAGRGMQMVEFFAASP